MVDKPGAGSNIATDQVQRAAPDGYTLLFVAVTSAINQTLYKNVNFDLTRDFAPVALGAKVPNILVVNPQVPVKTVQELVDYAKKNPGKLAFAVSAAPRSTWRASCSRCRPASTCCTRAYLGGRAGHHRPDRRPGAVHVRQHALGMAARAVGRCARWR